MSIPLSPHARRRLKQRRSLVRLGRLAILGWILAGLVLFLPALSPGAQTPLAPAAGKSREVIVLFNDADIQREAVQRRRLAGIGRDDGALLAFKQERFRLLKAEADSRLPAGKPAIVRDYSHLPMRTQLIRSDADLAEIRALPEVRAVYENRAVSPVLTVSLPFINQPQAAALGFTGAGTSVAVIDTGIDYTLPAFGSCTAPGTPAGCRVTASVDMTGNGVTLNQTPGNHGTNVAGIVAGVAPGTGIAAVNIFSGGSASFATVLDALNWVIANRDAYRIAAINMSFSDGGRYTSLCGDVETNPFVVPIASVRDAGIVSVAASGNNGYTDGISIPACTPGVVSVGAVYDAAQGGPLNWGSGCTDAAPSAPDGIPCFSNSAPFLTMLAPGAFITAAGIQISGTSQAAPHVAGAAAVLRAAFPADTPDQTVGRLVSGGVPVTDPRNGQVTPRLNLFAALGSPDGTTTTDPPQPVPALSPPGLLVCAGLLAVGLARKKRGRSAP